MQNTSPLKKPETHSENLTAAAWDTIVIGSGMGGMACAAALAKYGQKVLVLEQHYVAGGLTHTFSRKGYKWDVGVHCIGQMGEKDAPGKLLRWLSNHHIQMKTMGSVYETFNFPDGFTFTYPDSHQELLKQLYQAFPNEKSAIDQYFELVRKISKASRFFFSLRAMPEWLATTLEKASILIGDFSCKKYWTRTTADVLNELTTNERLKSVLTAQWGYYGGTPKNSSFGMHALVIKHYWRGGYYPIGGSEVIAQGLLKTVSEAKGATQLRSEVEQILVKNGKAVGVWTKKGEKFLASRVVSAAGARVTVQKLLPAEYQKSKWGQSILDLKQSPSYICLNLGFEGDILAAGATVSNQWFFETWNSELSEWDINDPESIAPVLYVSFPSLKDPHHEPGPGIRHTGEVITFVPWSAFERWKHTRRGKRESDYITFKKGIEERLLNQLRKHLPKVTELVRYHELSTPLSTEFFIRAPHGAIYGLEPSPKRFSEKQLRTRTPIKNLFLAGSDVATMGVTGALMGGVLTAASIDRRVFSQLMNPPSEKE